MPIVYFRNAFLITADSSVFTMVYKRLFDGLSTRLLRVSVRRLSGKVFDSRPSAHDIIFPLNEGVYSCEDEGHSQVI